MLRNLKRFYYFSNNYNSHKNYYHILGVSTSAPIDQIKRAYKLLAKQYHPDVNKGKEEQFKNINQAYQVLSDTHLRNQYDSSRISEHMTQRDSTHSAEPAREGRRWEGVTQRQRQILEMLRRQQEEFLKQHRETQRKKYYSQSPGYEQAMRDQYVRRYHQRLHRRQSYHHPPSGEDQNNNNPYNKQFDRSKDSIFKFIGENVSGLWQAWKQIKGRR